MPTHGAKASIAFFATGVCALASVLAAQPVDRSANRTEPAGPPSARPAPAVVPGPRAVFVPVEAGTSDASPLSTTNRGRSIDLRLPTNFERVYELRSNVPDLRGGTRLEYGVGVGVDSSSPLQSARARWFARISGGLVAIFPRSTYVDTGRGLMAEVPAGTIYSIGAPPATFMQPRTDTGSFQPLPDTPARPREMADRRVRLEANVAPADAHAAPTRPATVTGDETFRVRRVKLLLAKARREGASARDSVE